MGLSSSQKARVPLSDASQGLRRELLVVEGLLHQLAPVGTHLVLAREASAQLRGLEGGEQWREKA